MPGRRRRRRASRCTATNASWSVSTRAATVAIAYREDDCALVAQRVVALSAASLLAHAGQSARPIRTGPATPPTPLVRLVGTVREQTTTKAVFAARGLVFGIIAAFLGVFILIITHHRADAWDPGAARARRRPARRRCTSATSSSVEFSASPACCCSRSATPAQADRSLTAPLASTDADSTTRSQNEIHHVRRPPRCS